MGSRYGCTPGSGATQHCRFVTASTALVSVEGTVGCKIQPMWMRRCSCATPAWKPMMNTGTRCGVNTMEQYDMNPDPKDRKISALKGVITKLKKRIAKLERCDSQVSIQPPNLLHQGAQNKTERAKSLTINLNPRESECAVCGCSLTGCRHGIPFHEGEPVRHDWDGPWVGRDACTKCFNEYEEAQKKCAELTRKDMCKRWFKRCNHRCHSKY